MLQISTPLVAEKFHLNRAQLTGAIQRIWSEPPDVLARLVTANGERFLLMLPGGAVNNQPLTLMKDDLVAVEGYLIELPYQETGRQFLERAGKLDLLADTPGLADACSQRMATALVVENLILGAAAPVNKVTVEGLVARRWDKGNQQFARLAIYDCHTEIAGEGRGGHPRRIAHYVSLLFPDGLVNGRSVALKTRDHVRVLGRLTERRYSESFGYFLMRAGAIGLLAEAPNADDIRELRVPRVATYVIVESLLQFTK